MGIDGSALRRAAVGAALVVVITALASPALNGAFIYDDLTLLDHPYLSGEDPLAVFGRNSADYLDRADDVAVRSTATWRPLPMFSLVAVQALAGPSPLAHHLLSWALHLLTLWLLAVALAQRGAERPIRLIAVLAVGLHPALGEAWLWINGRSDVLAGLLLAATAVALGRPAGVGRTLALGLALVAGALSKETFLPAALGLILADGLGGDGLRAASHSGPSRAHRLVPFALWSVAAVAFWFGRAATMRDLPVIGGEGLPDVSALAERALPLWAMGMETLALPAPRGMRLLSYELAARPWQGALPLVLVAVALCGVLWARGARPAAVLVVTAAATLAPGALVSDAWWFGFDRYLYLPALLLALALGSARWPERVTRRRLALGLGGLWLAVSASSLYRVAGDYADPRAFALAMVERRPDDPTGAIWLAREALHAGQPATAVAILDQRPETTADAPPLTAAILHQIAQTYLEAGRADRAAEVVEDAARLHPDNANVRFDVMALRAGQGRFDEALESAAALMETRGHRAATAQMLRRWVENPRLPEDARERARALLDAAPH